jgi:hypothetical protein
LIGEERFQAERSGSGPGRLERLIIAESRHVRPVNGILFLRRVDFQCPLFLPRPFTAQVFRAYILQGPPVVLCNSVSRRPE